MTNPIDTFLHSVTAAAFKDDATGTIFAPHAGLDATVPNWRFTVSGGPAVAGTFAEWFGDPGRFEELIRTPIPGGEMVEFSLAWEERGVPHACHQLHIIKVEDGVIVSDRVFCGGRWPADLLAEMAAAANV